MAIEITTAREAATLHGFKGLVHGRSGAGKTSLAKTTGAPTIILSAEAGLLSLRDTDIPVIIIKNVSDLEESYEYIKEQNGRFEWVILDSITEIAEQVLASEKELTKDPRQAYGALIDKMMAIIKGFRDLEGKNVIFTCKQEYDKDRGLNIPMMPGAKLGAQLPYLFDAVFALRVEKNSEGEDERYLQTQPDFQFDAKDRSGVLDMFEQPNLATIAAKINNSVKPQTQKA